MICLLMTPDLEDNPLTDYILSYGELLYYLLLYTAIAVTVVYTFMGICFFLLNRNIRLIFLPFLYAFFGAFTGFIDGSIMSATLAAVYISVPYSLSKRRAMYMAGMQALFICYCRLSRNNRVKPFLVV